MDGAAQSAKTLQLKKEIDGMVVCVGNQSQPYMLGNGLQIVNVSIAKQSTVPLTFISVQVIRSGSKSA